MRSLALSGSLLLAGIAAADKPKPFSPDIKNVAITLSFKEEVPLVPRKRRSDPIAKVPITISIKNTGIGGVVPFSLQYLQFPAMKIALVDHAQPRGWQEFKSESWSQAVPRGFVSIPPGQTYSTTVHISFLECPGQARPGDSYTLTVKLYGHEVAGTFTFK